MQDSLLHESQSSIKKYMSKKSIKALATAKVPDAQPRKPAELIFLEHSQLRENCHEPGCDHLATTQDYCRAHYIKNWTRIKEKEEILRRGQFQKFARQLLERCPDSILHRIRHDLSSEEAFERACQDLALREGLLLGEEAIDAAAVFLPSLSEEETDEQS